MAGNLLFDKRRCICVLSAVIGGVAALSLLWQDGTASGKHMGNVMDLGQERSRSLGDCVSLDSGFYAESQWIQIEGLQGAEIYYTDNCEVPNRERGIRYTEPIPVEAGAEESVSVYRFRAFYGDGTESETETRTYFMGNNIRERYSTPVLHITGDPEGLFGYEGGIFVGGKIFDEFVKANPNVHFGGGVDANFTRRGSEWERPAYIQYFDAEGREVAAQNGGIRINGGMTRMKNQKSFKLYARKEYDEANEFAYPFLVDFVSARDGSLAKKYKRLILRNSGNDNGFTYIRSELACTLAADAGFPDVKYAAPVCVYINGEYKGVYWLENDYDASYFEMRYGEYAGEFVVLEGGDIRKAAGDASWQLYADAFNEQYQKFSEADLTVDENYEALRAFMDVENYLQYFAIENYVGNGDWPGGNVKAYRYASPDGSYEEGTVFDGRYRHLLFDLDYGFGLLLINRTIGTTPQTRTLSRLIEEESPLFAALMKREDCRRYFINFTCDLRSGAMSPSHVAETLDKMDAARRGELSYMLENSDLKEELWTWEDALSQSYEDVAENCKEIKYFATERQVYALTDIVENLGEAYENLYTLHVSRADMRSTVQINSMLLEEEEFEGVYFADVPVSLKPRLAMNEAFDHWMVNGSIRKDPELRLSKEDLVNQEIRVELVTRKAEDVLLSVSAVRAKGHSDFIEVKNYSDRPVNTRGYFLSDSEDAYQYALPEMIMQPGETLRLYGRDCMDGEGLGQFGMNFNLKRDEIVTLTYGRQTVETLRIPRLLEDGLYQKDAKTGVYREVWVR